MFAFSDPQDSSSMLCLKPSLELITTKHLAHAFGLYHTSSKHKTTTEYPKLTKFLQYASKKMEVKEETNLTGGLENNDQIIEALNDKVVMVVLEDTVRPRKPLSLHIQNMTFYKYPDKCSNNKRVSYSPLLRINYVSTFIFLVWPDL